MPFDQILDPAFRIMSNGFDEEGFYTHLNELREKDPDQLELLRSVCLRLKFVDILSHNVELIAPTKHYGYINSKAIYQNKPVEYQLDRLKTYLTLTCIDVIAGRGYQTFDEWLVSELKKQEKSDSVLQFLLDFSNSISEDVLTDKLRSRITGSLKDAYISNHGVRNKYLLFIKQDIPLWLKEWLGKVYYIQKGQIRTDDDYRQFIEMGPEEKLNLLADYYFHLRNKYTHTVQYMDTHEDVGLPLQLLDYPKTRGFSWLSQHKDGDPEKRIEWEILIRNDLIESDIIRLILLIQIRNKVLGMKDSDSYIQRFFDRKEYRLYGYFFLQELLTNIEVINAWCIKYLNLVTQDEMSLKDPLLQDQVARKFSSIHRSLYPTKPVSTESLDHYLSMVTDINQRMVNHSRKGNGGHEAEKLVLNSIIESSDIAFLRYTIKNIFRDLSHHLEEIHY